MSSTPEAVEESSQPAMGVFERYLSLWVALCIVAGIALGHFFPGPFQFFGRLELAQVNLPVAVLIWLMIIPMLLKVCLLYTSPSPRDSLHNDLFRIIK